MYRKVQGLRFDRRISEATIRVILERIIPKGVKVVGPLATDHKSLFEHEAVGAIVVRQPLIPFILLSGQTTLRKLNKLGRSGGSISLGFSPDGKEGRTPVEFNSGLASLFYAYLSK